MTDYSKVKLVVTDMDGTLLHSDYSLNPEFFQIYQQLKELDVRFMAASGRQYYSLLGVFESIQDDMYFIAENGGNVIHQDQSILTQPMDNEIIKEVVQIFRTHSDTEVLVCGLKNAYVEELHPEFEKYVTPYYPRTKLVPDLLEPINDQIVKMAIYNKNSSEENVYPYVKQLEKEEYQVKVSGKNWLDVSVKNSNKGFALKKVLDVLQISPEETMVFGDYLNDLEMMKVGYFNFAMANAHPQLKEMARFHTASNDEDGVLKVLRELIQQRKNK